MKKTLGEGTTVRDAPHQRFLQISDQKAFRGRNGLYGTAPVPSPFVLHRPEFGYASNAEATPCLPVQQKPRISAFSSSSLFSATNATEWHRFERDGLVLHLAHNDEVRARELLNALLIGRNEIRRKLGGTPAIPIWVLSRTGRGCFSRIDTRAIAALECGGLHFSNRAPLFCKPAPTIYYRLRDTNLPTYFCTPSRPSRVPVWFHEGVAMWASHEWRLRQSAAVFYAVFSENLIPLSEIDEVLSFPSAKADLGLHGKFAGSLVFDPLGRPQCRSRHAFRNWK